MKTRSFVSALSLVIALGMVGCSGEDIGQDQEAVKGKKVAKTYLALGDSVPFGYNPFVYPIAGSYVGYPTYVSAAIDKVVTNAACPGETTESMFNDAAIDNGCDEFKAAYNYYNNNSFLYSGNQLDFAIAYLMQHPETEVVTVQLGANDVLMALHACNDDIACVLTPGPSGYSPLELALYGVGQNLGTIVGTLRAIGYAGKIIMPFYYSMNYADEAMTGAMYYLNEVIAQVAAATGAKTADTFGAFYQASYAAYGDACAAGLLLPSPYGGCDMHPSAAGAQLIAQVVTAVEGQY